MRFIFILTLIIFSATIVHGQSIESKPSQQALRISSNTEFPQEASPSVLNNPAVVKASDSFHLSGSTAEMRLRDPNLKKDDQLTEKNFIIERSPDIKIEYVPENPQKMQTKERPL